MDILLTHAYFLFEDKHELRIMKPYPPLGILSLSAYLKQKGYHVCVYDATFGSLAEFSQILEKEKPPVVGIYCTLMTKFGVLAMVRASKSVGSLVVLGGPEPANYADEYLDRGADVIVFGEGETALENLLPALRVRGPNALDEITGIAFRRCDGTTVRTSMRPMIGNLDSLPDPDRDAIDTDRYLNTWRERHGLGSVSLICARGCPYHCTWCSHAVYGHTHRRRSPQRVAAEVETLAARFKPDQIWYADDVFTIDHLWLSEYAGELKKRGMRIPFECTSRADRLNEEIIALLAAMGCCRLWLGSESGSQKILDSMRRGAKVEQIRSVTHSLRRHGIETGMFIMLGYDGEEMADLQATLDHLKSSAPDIFLTTIAYPIKGTEYCDSVQKRVYTHTDWENRSDRDFNVRGRHSRRFYSFATRWIVNSVTLRRECRLTMNPLRAAKAAANAVVGRLGMLITAKDVD